MHCVLTNETATAKELVVTTNATANKRKCILDGGYCKELLEVMQPTALTMISDEATAEHDSAITRMRAAFRENWCNGKRYIASQYR
jgi:hypothetical protein